MFEQNAADATWGFGVVFSEQALEFLREDDPDTVDAIAPKMESWTNITLNLRGERIEIDGIGFSSIGRLELLRILQQRAAAEGVVCRYETPVQTLDQLVVLRSHRRGRRHQFAGPPQFRRRFRHVDVVFDQQICLVRHDRRFETLSQTFVETELGSFNAHHYRYSPAMSTFLVECDRATWERYGFADKSIEQSKDICERVFAETLGGHPLISNRSVWRNFPWLWNERWSFKNMVLIGDALHTAHFSIGSGTRLAIEDAIALIKALEAAPTIVAAALAAYEAARKPIVEEARGGGAFQRRLVREISRAHAARPARFRIQLHHTFRADRSGTAEGHVAGLHGRDTSVRGRHVAFRRAAMSATQAVPVTDLVPSTIRARGKSDSPFPSATTRARILFDNSVAGRGERTALVGPGGRLSYAELCAEASRWGNGFRSLGLSAATAS